MEILKAVKFDCIFQGIATEEVGEYSNDFDYDKDVVSAFTIDAALMEWLRTSFDCAISPSVTCFPRNKEINYGDGSFESFLTSKHVTFNQIDKTENKIHFQIKFNGRDDFLYEIHINKAEVPIVQ